MFLGRETLEDHSQLPKKANKCSVERGCKLFVCMAACHQPFPPCPPPLAQAHRRKGSGSAETVYIYGVPFVLRLMQPKQPADLLNRTTDLLNSFSDLLNRTADLLNRTEDLLNRTVDLLYRTADLLNRTADLLNQAVDMLNPLLDLLNQAADLLNPLYNLLNLCCALDYPYSSFDHTSLIG